MAQHRSGGAKDLVITYIKGDGCFLKFWALPVTAVDTVKNIENHFLRINYDLEKSRRFSSSEQIPVGLKCVVNSKIRKSWCRARVLLHQGYTVLVQLLDYGNEENVSIADVRRIDEQLQSIPAQAVECILADVIPARSNEWTPEAIKFCEEHLLYNTLSCFVVSEYLKLPVVRVAKKGESEAFVQRLINTGLALIKPEGAAPPPPTLSYKMNNMDQNSTHLVRISCIENAYKFYVQLSVAEMELKHLMDSVNRLPKETLAPLTGPAVHMMPCLAQLSSKPHSYYRGLITCIQQTRCKVFFVDYGFSELKDVQELRTISPMFLNLPAQAICCSLPREMNIDPEEFKRLLLYDHLDLTVLNRTTEVYIVTLSFRGQDVLSPPPPPPPQNYVQQKLQIGGKCEVTVSYVNSITEFYCQLTQFKEQQNMISNILNSGYNFVPISLQECTPGKPVCVKFSEDNLWYRARIVKVNHESDIEVFFVDFGNFDNVNLSDVRRMGVDVVKFPIQAYKCHLFETVLPSDPQAIDAAFDLLEELTIDQCLLAQVNIFSGDSGYGVTLYSKNSPVTINEKIQSSCLSIPSVSVNDVENLYITSFDSPNSFFGQFEKLDSDKLAEMQEQINTFYSGTQNTSYVPKEGDFVCARFNEDNQYYRARVEACSDKSCDVYFIDYGNKESIPIKDVFRMDASFTKYPQFGIECALENCPAQIPNEELSDLMLENSVQLKMIRKETDKWFVSLVESFPGNVAISEFLKQREKPVPRSIHGTGLSGYQEKSSDPYVPRSNSRSSDYSNNSRFSIKNETITSYNKEVCPNKESPKISAKEFEDYFATSIPPNAYRNVYVSHVISPSEFYCQIEEENIKLQSLMKAIEDVYTLENDLSLSEFVVGSPCCAMFEDGAWYRGKIKKVNSDSCDVFFVDYGNTDAVSKSKIKTLRSDLLRWSSQALCCKSFNVSPKGKDWSSEDISAFIGKTLDKSFVAQFVECDSNHVYAVNLVSIGKLQNDVFNKEFVNMGYGRLQDSSKTLVLNCHAASTNLSFSPLDVKIGSSETVQVFYGLNPGEIFCQLKSYAEDFKRMMVNLQEYYNKVPEAESLIDRPHQGMICAAQFFLDSAWYRAEIKKVEANKLVVFYVDYGNLETVDRKKVRCIIQEYTTLPMQAIKCRINGIKPPGKSWTVTNNLSKYFEGNTICKFISKDGDCFLVDMICNQKDVAQLLISDKIAVSDTPSFPNKVKSPEKDTVELPKRNETVSSTITESSEKIPERKDSFVPGQLISVTVSFIDNPSKFWCQLLDESDILDQLMADIESQISEISAINSASLNVGSYCIAQYFEDEAWYRAQIKSCEPENAYKVFFIDYGNTEIVSESQMKVMPSEFMDHSAQCFECCLLNSSSKLSPEITTLFRNTVEEVEEITAKIENVRSGVCTVTLLFDKDDQEINVSELLFGVEEHLEESDISKESPRYSAPDVPLGLQDGYVSTVNSPQDFYIQLANIEDTLADLSAELADICESSASVDASELCVGYACTTKYSEDNNWYRAEVIAVKDSTVDVLFVDYGNVDTTEKDLLKKLNEKHLSMPPLAIKCKLNGIVPATEEWSDEAINTFQDMVLESCLGITFISKDIPATVNITKDDKEVSQCLVDMELANVESCTETDEAYAEDHLAPVPIEDPLSSLPNDQSYPERKLHSTKHAVKICYVDSYDKFYVTPLELGTDLETVMNTLNILYASAENTESEDVNPTLTEVLDDPKVSMPCVAKYSEDEAFYRALITEIDGENIYVTFIDYGNSEITTLQNLRPITPELVKIPPISLECSLFGIEAVEGQEQVITTKLEEYFVDEVEFEMEICEFSPYKIKLYSDGDIGSMLIKEGLAKEKSVLPVEIDNFVDNSKITFVDESLEYKIQISKRFFSGANKIIGNVKFCEIENDLVVFHVVSTDLEDDLQELQQKLQDAYSEPPQNLVNVACMDFCATKYMEDENWYRAQVLSFDKDKVKVRFIDYGNCETVDKSDIYELLSDFTVEPQFSVKCVLFGLKANKSKEVELQDRLDELVYHESIELILCKHSHALYDLCITSLVCGDTNISEVLTNEMLVSQQYIISSKFDVTFKATIQKIDGDIIFLLPSNTLEDRANFQCKLQDVCKSLEASPEVQTHQLYAAKFDNIWYRVSVINISDNEITVDLVDFGYTKIIHNTEFVLLPVDICHQPIFLQPCVVKSYLTGNAKIDIQHLSIGSEISCEVQKTYPIVHPFTVKIVEVDQNVKENVTMPQENDVCNEDFNKENIDEENKENKTEENVESRENIAINEEQLEENVKSEDVKSEKDIIMNQEEFNKNGRDLKENSAIEANTDSEEKDEMPEENIAITKEETGNFEENAEFKENAVMDEEEVKQKVAESEEEFKEKDPEYEEHALMDEEEFKEIAESEEEFKVKDAESEENALMDEEEFKEKFAESGEELKVKDAESGEHALMDKDEFKEKVAEFDEEFKELAECQEEFKEKVAEFDEEFKETAECQEEFKEKDAEYEVNIVIDEEESNEKNEISKESVVITEEESNRDLKYEDEENYAEVSVANTQNEEYSNVNNIEENIFVGTRENNECEETTDVLEENRNKVTETTLNSSGDEKVLEKNEFDGAKGETEEFEEAESGAQEVVEFEDEFKSIDENNDDKMELAYEEISENKGLNSEISDTSRAKCDDFDENYIQNVEQNIGLTSGNKTEESFSEDYSEESNKECDIQGNVLLNSAEIETSVKTANESTENEESNLALNLNTNVDQKPFEEMINRSEMKLENNGSGDDNLSGDNCANIEKDFECAMNSSDDNENNRGIEDSYQLSGSVEVKVSHITVSNGSVIFAVQPLYLQEEFLLLKQNMQDCYSSKTASYDITSETNYCVVSHENEWYRGKILHTLDDSSTVMLIDYGKCETVNNSNIKSLSSEHSNVPPFAVWCTLSSVICPTEKSETATTFLNDKLKNVTANIKILEGDEPYKINLFINGSSILNELLKSNLVIQKLPSMYLQPGSFKAKLSSLNVNSEIVQIFVNLTLFLDDYLALFDAMKGSYKKEDFLTNVVDSGVYAAFYNDAWYRGLVVSQGDEIQVYLVDTGETITNCKSLCFLLPEHCLQPAYAIPCHIPFSDIKTITKISESVNNVLTMASEFLVDIEVCPDSNSISATLIDERVVSEVKNLGLSCTSDSEINGLGKKEMESDATLPTTYSSLPTTTLNVQEQETSEQLVGYLEETFTTESSFS